MIQAQILIVEDDVDINTIVFKRLSKTGFSCTQAFSGTEGALLLESHDFDLAIVDLLLPGIPGEDVVRRIRARSLTTPVIIISARTDVVDKVALLKMGADDYLTKPFDLDELVARIEVQLRRMDTISNGHTVQIGDWLLDSGAHTLTAKGKSVSLTRTEYSMIELLATHPNKVFTKQELYEYAWNEPYSVDDGTLNVHMSNIRSKLKKSGTDTYIQTVWGLGFRLADV